VLVSIVVILTVVVTLALVGYFFFMAWITPSRYLPIVSSAVGTFSTFRMLPVVIQSVIKPFGKPFKVTPKGSGNEENEFDAYTFACIAILIAVTALGLVINILPEWSQVGLGEFSVVSVYWAVVNIVVLMIAALICFERPRPLLDSFKTDEPAWVRADDRSFKARLVNLALDNGILEVTSAPGIKDGDTICLELPDFPPLKARVTAVVPRRSGVTCLKFSYSVEGECRDRMIVKLYTGNYSQDIHELDRPAIVGGVWKRAFGEAPAS